MISRFMVMIYLAKEDTRKAYSNIYMTEGEIWNALLRWNQDVSQIKNRADVMVMGSQK